MTLHSLQCCDHPGRECRIVPCSICDTPVHALPEDGPNPICGDSRQCLDDALDVLEENGGYTLQMRAEPGKVRVYLTYAGDAHTAASHSTFRAMRQAVARARGYHGDAA